jgi:hypothetical protein
MKNILYRLSVVCLNPLCSLCLCVWSFAILTSECLARKNLGTERFEVLSAVLTKIQVFWDVTRCRLVVTDV